MSKFDGPGGRAVLGVMLALLFLMAPAPAAVAEGGEREEYVAHLEPICMRNVLANRRIFKGAKDEVRHHELRAASRHFLAASRAFAETIGELAAVPRPAEDRARLGRWFADLRTERSLIERIGQALAAEEQRRAEALSQDLNHNSIKTNNVVLLFGFHYCRIEPSRFG